MRVRVKLFAQLRDYAGTGDVDCDVDDAATVNEVWQSLAARHPAPQRISALRSTLGQRDKLIVGRDLFETALAPVGLRLLDALRPG